MVRPRCGAALVVLLVMVSTCEAGLLGISRSRSISGGSEKASEDEGKTRAQTGQGRLMQDGGRERGGTASVGDAPMIGKPMLGKSGARPWNMPPASGMSMRTTSSQGSGQFGMRGPVTGMSKRMMQFRKRRPSEEGKAKATDEINMAVGELEGMQLDIQDKKYRDDVMGVSKVRKPNGLYVADEKRLNQTLSAFGRKQRARDLYQGLAGRYRTRRPNATASVRGFGAPRNSTMFSSRAAPWSYKPQRSSEEGDVKPKESASVFGSMFSAARGQSDDAKKSTSDISDSRGRQTAIGSAALATPEVRTGFGTMPEGERRGRAADGERKSEPGSSTTTTSASGALSTAMLGASNRQEGETKSATNMERAKEGDKLGVEATLLRYPPPGERQMSEATGTSGDKSAGPNGSEKVATFGGVGVAGSATGRRGASMGGERKEGMGGMNEVSSFGQGEKKEYRVPESSSNSVLGQMLAPASAQKPAQSDVPSSSSSSDKMASGDKKPDASSSSSEIKSEKSDAAVSSETKSSTPFDNGVPAPSSSSTQSDHREGERQAAAGERKESSVASSSSATQSDRREADRKEASAASSATQGERREGERRDTSVEGRRKETTSSSSP